MPSQRIKSVNELIKKTISGLILKEIDFPKGMLVTITQVHTTPDLNKTSIFVSAIPDEKIDLAIRILNKNIYQLQKKMNKILFMKNVPRMEFRKETKTVEAQKIERLLDELKKGRKTDNIQAEE